MIIVNILFVLSGFMIFWAMIGYPVSILLLGKVFKNRQNKRDWNYKPSVTVMIVAHNEEKVIKEKLDNVCALDYYHPIDILIASDQSTDKTNAIVEEYIKNHPEFKIRLYKSKKRMGKTNAQNEAQKTVTSEILVMTDANAMLDKQAIKELVSCFASPDIFYVTGVLKYINSSESATAESENTYWSLDVKVRDIESRIQTITAGNGALYACRNAEYVDFDPIQCHDSAMPYYYGKLGKRAINCMSAIAYEKAGETNQDEFKRKVRMNRGILSDIFESSSFVNIFRYKWATYFFFGHRFARYMLWLNHIILFFTNSMNFREGILCYITFIIQILIYTVILLQIIFKTNVKFFRIVCYYGITVIAQIMGVYNILTGNVKATWEKVESTR